MYSDEIYYQKRRKASEKLCDPYVTQEEVHEIAIEFRKDAVICLCIVLSEKTSQKTLSYLYENFEDPFNITSFNIINLIVTNKNCPDSIKMKHILES